MAVYLGAIRKAKYYVYFGSKKVGGFSNSIQAKLYANELEKEGYPATMIYVKHKGKDVDRLNFERFI